MLHDEEARRHASCGFANVVQATDMWMIERSNRASLAFEPLSSCGIGGKMLGQHLDGDDAIQTGVARLVDFAHSPGADQPDDFVGAKPSTRRERHRSIE